MKRKVFNNIYIGSEGFVEEDLRDNTGRNISVGYGLNGYDKRGYESFTSGNVFYNGAKPYKNEVNFISRPDFLPTVQVEEKSDGVWLSLLFDHAPEDVSTQLVTTESLGFTIVSEAVFEQYDGAPYVINTDFFGNIRKDTHPGVGPFENLGSGAKEVKIW